jgi:hypothetical protein
MHQVGANGKIRAQSTAHTYPLFLDRTATLTGGTVKRIKNSESVCEKKQNKQLYLFHGNANKGSESEK